MRILVTLALIFCCTCGYSEGLNPEHIDLSFRRISPIGGFTYGAINSIGEDSDGFIWFGTVHGLYQYNTVDVRKFVYNPLDSTTIPGNSIRSIFCDSNGTLWIGTTQGACSYEKSNNRFIRRNLTSRTGETLGNGVRDIFQYNSNTIYFLSTTLLGKLDSKTNEFEKVFGNELLEENFQCAELDHQGNIWIGGSNGTVWKFDAENKQIQKFCQHRSESIGKILATDNGVWIGYNWAGLDLAGYQGDLIRHFGGNINDVYKIHHNRVRDIYEDDLGRIWISTYKGISIIEKDKIYNTLSQEITGLPYNSIYKIFKDSKNGIWIGTWSGGLAYQSNFDNRFIHSRKDQLDPEIDDEFVSSFAEKLDGTIIIGTEFGNLNLFDRESNQMINIPYKTENGKKIENIKSLWYDQQTETLWVGTFLEGLWYMNMNNNDHLMHQLKIFTEQRVSVYSLAKSDSFLFIGTFGNGLYCYNTINRTMKQYVSSTIASSTLVNDHIRSLIVASDSSVWIGTSSGLNQFDPYTEQFKLFTFNPNVENSISSDEIYTIQEDHKGSIWVGTSGGGLNKYDPESNTFKCYRVEDGLAGNDVYGIEEDQKGQMWISTDNGITNIDLVRNSFRNFYREDELYGNQFNPGAVFKTEKGEILFGDTKGFTFFKPEQMKTNPFAPNVIFTSLSINNVPVDNHGLNSLLKRTLQTRHKIELSYQQNSLTFNFVANNFLLPNKNKFKYRLINYDENWIESGNQNFATYTKIPPGSYTFEVIACNNDNVWHKTPSSLSLVISPPFWLSVYAYFLYFLVIALIIYFIRKWVLERQQFKKEILLERYTREAETQLQEMKLRFFTNISHEFRTPLTLIVSPINQLLDKFKLEAPVQEHLLTMQRNSNRLLRLINQLIDLRKIELGKAVLQPENFDLVALTKDVASSFETEIKDKNFHFIIRTTVEKMNVYLDREKTDKIFFNILSNAMKFTPESGSIEIKIYQLNQQETSTDYVVIGDSFSGKRVCVEFSDNGSGIPSNELKLIFERFEQGEKNHSSGTGIGLHMAYEYTRMQKGCIKIKSTEGEGTTFIVCFPIHDINGNSIKDLKDAKNFVTINLSKESSSYTKEALAQYEQIVTVLIIEDNAELRSYLKQLLGPHYTVVTSKNGKQGLEMALTILPDLVITDVMMPQMDGFEVCRQLKNNVHTSHIPVILLTALNETEKHIDGLKTGADAYIAKPFDENLLIAQIENILISRARVREAFMVSDTAWNSEMMLLNSDRMIIDKATGIIENHLHDKTFVVDDLARNLGISTSSLYRKLKILANQSPTEFIRYIRLKKAIKLMESGNSNLDEISYSIGFNSHSYFTSSFKKQFGKTPSEYMNDLKMKKGKT